MHHDVGGTGSGLVWWQRVGALRVHDGKLAPAEIAVHTPFQHALVMGNDAARRHLGTGGRDGQYDTYGQRCLRHGLSVPEVPHVALVGYAVGDGLRRVDDRSATDGQDEIDTLTAAETDALLHLRQQGIRHYPTQLHKVDIGLVEHLFHLIKKSVATGAATTVVDEHLRTAILSDQLRKLSLRLTSEHHPRRGIEIKVLHTLFYINE